MHAPKEIPDLPPDRGRGRPPGRSGPRQHGRATTVPEDRKPALEAMPPVVGEDAPPEDLDKLYRGLFADSPVKSSEGKHLLVSQVVTLHAQQLALRKLILSGRATAEEHRAVSGIANNVRRLVEALGLTSTEDKDLEL